MSRRPESWRVPRGARRLRAAGGSSAQKRGIRRRAWLAGTAALVGAALVIGGGSWRLLHLSTAAAEASSPPLDRAPDGRKLVMTFDEEFSRFRPWDGGSGVWRTTFGDGRLTGVPQRTLQANGELEVYVDADMSDAAGRIGVDPFKLRDGVLEITAARTPAALIPRLGGYAYTSGLITTQPSFSQRYGYFEMRARIPRGKGLWPAFWLLPADLSWPPEIDVMESVGDPSRVYVTAHSNTRKADGIEVRISPDAFHVFAVSWGPEMLVWYVDGREAGRQPTPPDLNKPMYMLANLALGGGWAGAPDATTPLPATYAIDYIRAYRFAS